MNSELVCTRCSRTRPSVYYFRAPGLCTECFANLAPHDKMRVEADYPQAPWQAATSQARKASRQRAVLVLVAVVIIAVSVWARSYWWALTMLSVLAGHAWREYQHRHGTA